MLRDFHKAAPWVAVFALTLVVAISATRATRHCLLLRQDLAKDFDIGVVHRVGVSFFGLKFCERAETVASRQNVF
jgi:hypothetical protein